jgi:hypothetical protein
MNELINELEGLLYNHLINSKNREITFDEFFAIEDKKPEYGLKKISGGAIVKLRKRPNVQQTTDESGYMLFRLIGEKSE